MTTMTMTCTTTRNSSFVVNQPTNQPTSIIKYRIANIGVGVGGGLDDDGGGGGGGGAGRFIKSFPMVVLLHKAREKVE